MSRPAGGARCVVAAALLLVAGCGGTPFGPGADDCTVDSRERPAPVLTPPEVEPTSDGANLGLDLVNASAEPARVTVRLDGDLALDLELPASGEDCAHHPVHRYTYRLPEGPTTITVTSDTGDDEARVRLGRAQRWAVVQVQEGFPTEVTTYGRRPSWG